jgi:crotonobetainyl-CoA:carnitine CoA-transferase CaiB-like acyl-CoA transferase
MSTAKKFFLKIVSSVAMNGEIICAGSIVEVDELVAKNLIARGKAELATEDDAPTPEPVEAEAEIKDEIDALLAEMTKAELTEFAKQFGVEVKSKDTNAQIIEAIKAAQPSNQE